MDQRYEKTDKGHQEVKDKTEKLSRPARTLLLIIDASRPVAQWEQLIHGATRSDIDMLVTLGLIRAMDAPQDAEPVKPVRSLEAALEEMALQPVV